MNKNTSNPLETPFRKTLGTLYRLILILSVLLILLLTGGRVFAASQAEFVAELTRGLAMQNGVVYPTHSVPPSQIEEDGEGQGENPAPTPTPNPEPSDDDYVDSLRGTPPPWGDAANINNRSPKILSEDEFGWLAANLETLTSSELNIVKLAIGNSPLESRLRYAPQIAATMAAIMADPASSAIGSFGGYATAYAHVVSGYTGISGNISALQPTISFVAPLSTSANFLRTNYSPEQWRNVLAFPLSSTQIASIEAVISGTGTFHPSMTPQERAALLGELEAINPSF